MRTFTTEHTVYTFAELSEEARQKALENLSQINVDYDFWEYDDTLIEIAKDYGIDLNMRDLCFDLYHREFYLDLHDHGREGGIASHISDDKLFLKRAGLDLRSKEARAILENGGIGLETQHYGGGSGATKINIDYADDVSAEIEEKLQETLKEFEAEGLKYLQATYDYLTSEEAIIETIAANEYEFYADGKLA